VAFFNIEGGKANDFVSRALLPTQEGTAWSRSVRRLRNRRPQISRKSQTGWGFACRRGCLAHSHRRCLARSSHRDGNTSRLSRIQTLSHLKTSTGFTLPAQRVNSMPCFSIKAVFLAPRPLPVDCEYHDDPCDRQGEIPELRDFLVVYHHVDGRTHVLRPLPADLELA